MKTLATVLLLASLAFAQKGTVTTYQTSWNGIPRVYEIYIPPVLQSPPAMVMVLHGTTVALPTAPPWSVYHNMAWDQLADVNGFIVVQPIATWKPIKGSPTGGAFFWESFGTETFFPAVPDDSGFLASLAQQVAATYRVDPKQMFVMGFSSGGMMTQRMCIEHADIFAACAPLSGTIFVATPPSPMPLPSQPISVLEMHGDADTTIPYCGGLFFGWGEGQITIPSVDVDVAYWLLANGLPAAPALCSGTTPQGFGIHRTGTADVQFVRELGYAHTYHQSTIAAVWEFFSTHGR